ncbi:MAG: RuBisCO large subunit C-terminal-like domain-containing protein [Myxococcota bacterium]
MSGVMRACYRLEAKAEEVEARAEALLYEQTVELPPDAVRDPSVRREILARLEGIEPDPAGGFRLHVAFPELATAGDPAQVLNVLFGNSSMHADLELVGVSLPPGLAAVLGGPRLGVPGIRKLLDVHDRPLTCTALKPMGLPTEELAHLCQAFARGGIDIIKDDHGLAGHETAPFEDRVRACQDEVSEETARSGRRILYAPNLIGTPSAVKRQLDFARGCGVQAVLVAPMLLGLPLLVELAREAEGITLLAHPAFSGSQRIAPAALFGTLLPAYGADAVIFPHAGGRFGFSLEDCGGIVRGLAAQPEGWPPALPVPAGGMSVDRVEELLAFYGRDCMLLVGGSLYLAGPDLEERTRAFVADVARIGGKAPRTGRAQAPALAAP